MVHYLPFLKHFTPKEQLTYILVVIIVLYHFFAALIELFLTRDIQHITLHIMVILAYSFFTLHYVKHKNFTLSIYAILTVSSIYFLIMLFVRDFALYSYFIPILLPIGTYIILSFKESILFIILHYTAVTLVSLYGYLELGIESDAFTFIALKVYVFIVTFILLFGMVYHLTISHNYKILSAENHQKEIALSEIHRRVKNDLNLISSMLSIHHFGSDKQDMEHIVKSNRSRIEAISILHELLYKEKNFESIRFESYVTSLCKALLSNVQTTITLDHRIKDISFPLKHMQNLGIILNELIINSIYYTMNQTQVPSITIKMTLHDETLYMTYEDNAQNCDLKKTTRENTLGLEFAKASAKQLGASITFECKNGFVCHIAMDRNLQTSVPPLNSGPNHV